MKKGQKHPLDPIYFPVRKVEASALYQNGDNFEFDPSLSHLIIAEMPNGKSRVINACSKDYGLFTNREVFEPIYQAMVDKFDTEVRAYNWGFNRVGVEFIIKDKTIPFDKGTLFSKVKIYNSYDSSVRYQAFMEIWRKECDNGLCLPVANMQPYQKNLLHTEGSRSEVEAITGIAEKFVQDFKGVVELYKPLKEAKRSKEEALEIMEGLRETTDLPKAALESAIQRLDVEIGELKMPLNDFLIYNCVNYGIYNADLALRDHKKQKLDHQILQEFLP